MVHTTWGRSLLRYFYQGVEGAGKSDRTHRICVDGKLYLCINF